MPEGNDDDRNHSLYETDYITDEEEDPGENRRKKKEERGGKTINLRAVVPNEDWQFLYNNSSQGNRSLVTHEVALERLLSYLKVQGVSHPKSSQEYAAVKALIENEYRNLGTKATQLRSHLVRGRAVYPALQSLQGRLHYETATQVAKD
jgi:hypothetical protein